MTRTRVLLATSSLAVAAVLSPVLASPAFAGSTHRRQVISRATDSDGGQYAGGTGAAHISANGDWLAFSRLTGTGSYVKSLVSGATTLVSLNDADQPANAASSIEGISSNGADILFSTTATNMAQDTPTARDLYVRHLATGHTERINLLGGVGTGAAVKPGESTLSDTGTYIAFTTTTFHVYVRSLANHVTEQVDVTSSEVVGNGSSGQPSITPDGRFITFTTFATNMFASDSNFVSDIVERDRQAGTTVRVSLSDTEVAPNLASDHSSVSDDGRYVAFASNGDNLVANDTNTDQDVFVRDVTGGTTRRISVQTGGAEAHGNSGMPDISKFGNLVAFQSSADDLDFSQQKGKVDVYLRDISGNQTYQQGAGTSSGPDQGATGPSLASWNDAVAFNSASANIVDTDTNAASDVFVQRWQTLGPFTYYSPLAIAVQVDFGTKSSLNGQTGALLEDGRLTTPHLIVKAAHDPVWAVNREPVARLYQAFFHREPDLGGLNFWVNKRSKGTKLSVIAASFASSNEFKTAYGSVGNSAFVDLVYNNVLQRKPDTAGLDHWVAKMAGGMSRGDVMVAFSESSEGRRFLAPEVDATLEGLGMLHAMPPKALWAAVATASHDAAMADAGAVLYLNSNEYGTLHP